MPACEGQGVITHEMSFLPDVMTACATCGGKRFDPRTLDVKYLGLSIGDVLDLTAEEASEFFAHHRRIAAPLRRWRRSPISARVTFTWGRAPTPCPAARPSGSSWPRSRLVERGDTLVVIEHHRW